MDAVPGTPKPLTPGAVVHVRSRQYLVEAVREPTPDSWETSSLVRLSCLADDALGESLSVLWDHELDARVDDADKAWDVAARRGYDEPRLFSAYLNTLRWNCVTATDPKLFQAPCRSRRTSRSSSWCSSSPRARASSTAGRSAWTRRCSRPTRR
jgi:hypothetical protein